jgi:hypothetical protein
MVLHGSSHATFDGDLAIAFDIENRHRAARALAPFNPRPQRLAEGAAWEWDVFCVRGPWTILATDIGRIDLIIRLPGVEGFDALYQRSEVFDVGGVTIRAASLEDLIRMKQVSERPKDYSHLLELQAIKRERDRTP